MNLIFIGFSTVNKSTIAKQLSRKYPVYAFLDSDKEISRQYNGSLFQLYYHFSHKQQAEVEIARLENAFLDSLKSGSGNYILAAGPDIPLRENFQSYIDAVKPTIILLEKSVEEIYDGLISRRTAMQRKEQHQRPEFGMWDWFDANLPKEEAMELLREEVQKRTEVYERYATIRFQSRAFFGGKVPSALEQFFIGR